MKFIDSIFFKISSYPCILRINQQMTKCSFEGFSLIVPIAYVIMLSPVDYDAHASFALRKSILKVLEHFPLCSLNLVFAVSI